MASLSEVANRASVSVTTASMVLNGSKRSDRISEGCAMRVREAARQLGYVPNYHARSMKLGRAEAVGVSVEFRPTSGPERGELGGSYFGTLVGAVEVSARRAGYAMTMIGADERVRALHRGIQAIRQRRIDGLVVLAALDTVPLAFDSTPVGREPVVVVEYSGPTQFPVVDWDLAYGVGLAIEHLVAMGHRRMLWLGPVQGPDTPPQVREKLVMEAAQRAGLQSEMCRFAQPWSSNAQPEEAIGDAAAEALALYIGEHGSARLSAIVCYSDATAIGAYRALQAAALRVPKDVSVIGFDDIEARLMVPKLTTVDHMLYEMGRRATVLLLEAVKHPENWPQYLGRRELVTPELVVRQSTGPAKS